MLQQYRTLFSIKRTGVNDHTYVIYDPRADSLEDWDNWNLICRVKILS